MKKIWAIALLGFIILPSAAQAISIDSGLGNTLEMGTADLESTVINIIQWALGLLGLIAVVMIIASVIIAATSSDADRADKAKKTIIATVIGLVVIILAWAIVTFVDNTGNDLTN